MLANKIPYTDEMLAESFARDIKFVKLGLEIFKELLMLEIHDGIYFITNWNNHQKTLDQEEKKREYDRKYQQEKRAKEKEKKEQSEDNCTTIVRQSYDCRTLEVEEEIDEKIDSSLLKKEKNVKKKNCSFCPPTLEAIKKYCEENNINIDCDAFHSYYTSIGWMVGSKEMVDWKASVKSWEIRKKTQEQADEVDKQKSLNKYTTGGFEEL